MFLKLEEHPSFIFTCKDRTLFYGKLLYYLDIEIQGEWQLTPTLEDNNPLKPEEFLENIHAGLKSDQAPDRLAAIQELLLQKFSSPAILRRIEQLALHDKSKPVREAARQALDSPTHRYIQEQTATLKQKDRRVLLDEIKVWEEDGLLDSNHAKVLRNRYNFDLKPTAPIPTPTPAPEQETPPPRHPEQTTHPSLTQTLLSETSIKIALYLGAFFVIAAAAILAAIVEAARLPILFIATAIFAGGALITRKRLPQPSFALFIVFSFLLPTDANVLADVLNLSSTANAGYWFLTMTVLAFIWGYGTWFYSSKLFSLAAFIALSIASIRLGEFLNAEPEIYVILLSFVTLLGIWGTHLLKHWQSAKFSRPLFIITQIAQISLMIFAIIIAIIRLEESSHSWWNLASVIFWLLTAGFYILSDLIFPFALFPWLAAIVLYPVPLMLIKTFKVEAWPVAIAFWLWGTLLATGSEVLRRSIKFKINRYSAPALASSTFSILTAIVIGFTENNIWGFSLLLASAILYTVLQNLKPRAYIWVTALLLWLGAYFTFFSLPFMGNVDVFIGYKLLGASLFFLAPDIFLIPDLSADRVWRWPLRAFGGLFTVANTFFLAIVGLDGGDKLSSIGQGEGGTIILIFSFYAVFFIPYALRLRTSWLGYIPTLFIALSAAFANIYFESNTWPLSMIGLAGFYYLFGYALGRSTKRATWGRVLCISGLSLSGIVSVVIFIASLFGSQTSDGWYILVAALFFGFEMYSHRADWAELFLQLFLASGTFLILSEIGVLTPYLWLTIALTLLVTDLVLAQTYLGKRSLSWISRGIGALIVFSNAMDILLNDYETQVGLICLAVYMVFFLVQALLYHEPVLGYGSTFFTTLTVIQAFKFIDQDNWLLPVTALAVTFYSAGFFQRKHIRKTSEENKTSIFFLDWPFVLWTSGLGAGILATAAAPTQGGLSAAIPVAVTATIVAIEAFDRRNVWLGFPANALYLMSYFILLVELKVDEPQFFSIATAALGLLMHYLLTRAGSRTGTFITGMVSQLVLLGTTYIQFVSTEKITFFVILFFQALVVLIYGIVIRSRSLVITPIAFAVLSVITVLYGLLEGILPVILIGCTGIILLMLGISAVIMRGRLKKISERFNDWGA